MQGKPSDFYTCRGYKVGGCEIRHIAERKEMLMEMVTKRQLQEMTRFYLKELFGNIPEIKVSFKGTKLGTFNMEAEDGYCEENDELINDPAYKRRYSYLGYGCGYDKNRDYAWQDPLNHPKVSISIKKSLSSDRKTLIMVLLHELSHYYLWYLGYGFRDDDSDFIKFCNERFIPTQYDREWTKENGWALVIDMDKARLYEEMFLGRMCA